MDKIPLAWTTKDGVKAHVLDYIPQATIGIVFTIVGAAIIFGTADLEPWEYELQNAYVKGKIFVLPEDVTQEEMEAAMELIGTVRLADPVMPVVIMLGGVFLFLFGLFLICSTDPLHYKRKKLYWKYAGRCHACGRAIPDYTDKPIHKDKTLQCEKCLKRISKV